ncbi:MAG: hypothetical protein ACR2PM_00065 [Hyphomicrobiales bacterium]
MLGAGASQTRADPEGVPQRVQGSGSAASELSVKTSEGVVDTSFSVSIREIADLLSRLPDGEVDAGDVKVDPSSKGDVARIALPPPKAPRRFDIWAEGRHRQDASSPDPAPSGEVYVGADYDISPILTVGALAGLNQFEPADSEAGDAWSGGPYARVRLMSNLSLTGLATWHRPETVNGEDAFDPAAEADRFRIINQLRGDWTYGAWRFKPSVGYEIERFDGRKARMVNFGPAIGYRHERPDGTVVEPHLAVKGRWDVAPIIGLEDDAYIPSWDGLDAKLEGGVRLQDFKGWSLDASTSVGGVGDPRGAIDWRGRLGIKVPLN